MNTIWYDSSNINCNGLRNIICEDVLYYVIFPFINDDLLKLTTKVRYEEYAVTIKDTLKSKYTNYIRFLLRNDYDYCLRIQLESQPAFFLKHKNFRYKKTRFTYCVDFLRYLSIQYKATKCKIFLETYKKTNKLYKKYTTYHNKWSN